MADIYAYNELICENASPVFRIHPVDLFWFTKALNVELADERRLYFGLIQYQPGGLREVDLIWRGDLFDAGSQAHRHANRVAALVKDISHRDNSPYYQPLLFQPASLHGAQVLMHITCCQDGIRYTRKLDPIGIALLIENGAAVLHGGISNELFVLFSLQTHFRLGL